MGHRGVVRDQDVEPPVPRRDDRGHGRRHVLGAAQVDRERDGAGAERLDLGRDRVQAGGIALHESDGRRAVAREPERRGPSESRSRSRDERGPPGEAAIVHDVPPVCEPTAARIVGAALDPRMVRVRESFF